MKATIDNYVGQQLATWVTAVQSKPNRVLLAVTLATLCMAVIAFFKLGINSNNLDLISPDLPSRIDHAEFSSLFPNLENALIIVVDGETAEATFNAAQALTSQLNQLSETIESAYSSNGGEFFRQNGLLYLELDELEDFSHELSKLRPFLIPLEREPNLVTAANVVVNNMRVSRFNLGYEQQWSPFIDHMNKAAAAALSDSSGSSKFLASASLPSTKKVALDDGKRQVIIAHPVLEFGNILAANRSIKAVRAAAVNLGIDADSGLSVRITGNPALNLDEMIGIAWDIGVAGIFCFALVVVVLIFALRSFPLVIATITTLLVGLVWTAGFAALAVGHLNIVSLSVAILFIGLGVDFAIHLGMRYAESLRSGNDELQAMRSSVSQVGSSLIICTISTSIAFLVFVPTPYLGVAELGLIAGAGMAIIMFLTVSLFPALLITYLRVDAKKHLKQQLRFQGNLGPWVQRHSSAVLVCAFVFLIGGLFAAQKAYFDPNVIEMRDPSTESVQTFNELLNQSGLASPWFLNAVASDLATADIIAKRAQNLKAVEQTITASNFIPTDQLEKLDTLNELSELFARSSQEGIQQSASIDSQLSALRSLQDFIAQDITRSDTVEFANKEELLLSNLSQIQALSSDSQTDQSKIHNVLVQFNENLIGGLATQLAQLRKSLVVQSISLASLPNEVVRRMVAEDGQARIQFFPKENLRTEDNLREFVTSVRTLAPKASGIAVNIIAFEEATKSSFKQALGSALFLITLLLIYIWRNLIDVFLVLVPLFLSLILAVACMGLLGIPFNFVNVIVIPLMFGIGVDSGIHLVQRSQKQHLRNHNLLNSTTARAVYFSALTTVISFGSLSLSAHKGMSSLGTLLAIGMVLTVICNLIVLPALLESIRKRN